MLLFIGNRMIIPSNKYKVFKDGYIVFSQTNLTATNHSVALFGIPKQQSFYAIHFDIFYRKKAVIEI
jgi:hypothetical protein